jgi:hypothetical protein
MPERFEPTAEIFLATKLKATLDRVEAKDYQNIAAMLSAGLSLEKALGAFAKMYGKDPGLVLRAIGYFRDGDLSSLSEADRNILRAARDSVSAIPDVPIRYGSLAAAQPLARYSAGAFGLVLKNVPFKLSHS